LCISITGPESPRGERVSDGAPGHATDARGHPAERATGITLVYTSQGDASMKNRSNAVAEKALDAVKSFIVLSLKTMFRRGASGGQIRSFLESWLPQATHLYNGEQFMSALYDLESDGTLERRGIRWCLARP
jgi:hypothetical protein